MPGAAGNDFADPNLSQLQTWDNTLTLLLAGNYNAAADSAALLSYQLVEFTDTIYSPQRTYYILENMGSNYWGTYIYYPNYKRPLVIQSPHPKKDANTGTQGVWVFRKSESMAFFLSGTHRCNNFSMLSTCSGTTTACTSTAQAYAISDLAHTTTSIFQKSTQHFLNAFGNTHFIQLHGFTKLATDPYLILSNGTQITPSPDYMSDFATHLYNEDSVLTFKIAHIDLSWTRLRGFWNTQSRLVNNSTNYCTTNASNTNGRFFHIEQEKVRLRNNSSGWLKISNALVNTFPYANLPVQLSKFNGTWFGKSVQLSWSTTMEEHSDYFSIERSTDGKDFHQIGLVEARGYSNSMELYNYFDLDVEGMANTTFYYRLKQYDLNHQFQYSKIIELNRSETEINYSIYPNPSRGRFELNSLEGVKQLSVFNQLGQLVYERNTLTNKNLSLDLSGYSKGLYQLVLQQYGGQRTTLRLSTY